MATEKSNNLSELFTVVNFIKIIAVFLLTTAVIWLNGTYVRHKELNDLSTKVVMVESRVVGAENRITNVEKQVGDVLPVLKSIERRLSNIITEDGKVIYDTKIINMEKDISLMQRDIQYIKEVVTKER